MTSPSAVTAVIVGAQRSATTSLAAALEEHSAVCLARGKEAHLFDDPVVQRQGVGPEELARAFPDARAGQILLDATPSYLYLPGCLEALAAHNPQVRVVAVLRDPGDRAVSHFHHTRWLGREPHGVLRAMLAERRRLSRSREPLAVDSPARLWSYADRGRYRRQVRRMLDLFPDALVLPFTRLVTAPRDALGEVQSFLGLSPSVISLGHMNRHGDTREHRLIAAAVRWRARGDTRGTEELLGWPRGTLRGSPGGTTVPRWGRT